MVGGECWLQGTHLWEGEVSEEASYISQPLDIELERRGILRKALKEFPLFLVLKEGKSLPQPKEENDDQYFTFPSFLRVWQEYKELSSEGGNTHRLCNYFPQISHLFSRGNAGGILTSEALLKTIF